MPFDWISLPGTDLRVSRLCFGTMTFGGQTDERTAADMIDLCLDQGINFFDTANVYTGGQSEIMTGKLLGSRRDQVIIASKVGSRMRGVAADAVLLSKEKIIRACEESLQRLGTDYLDIYYFHQPDYSVPLEESLEAAHALIKEGKIRYLGTSNYASWQVAQMHCIADRRGYHKARIAQPMYNVLARGIEQEFTPMCKELGVGTCVYNPLAGGFLTGKHKPGDYTPGTRFDQNPMYQNRYWFDAYFAAVESLRGAAEADGRTLVSLSLNWLFHHSVADCIILGASKLEHLRQNLGVFSEGPLSEEALKACDDAWRQLRGITPQYNR